jgi:crotonobetainyl-CoA:carnitine CoA-transferase CaiB-like acyl-CoA transferase
MSAADAGVVVPLAGLRVVQGAGGIDVAYCTKILVDAGAEVALIEPSDGHALRRRKVGDHDPSDTAALFHYLHAGKRSVAADDDVEVLLAGADVLVTDQLPEPWEQLHDRQPSLSVVAISPFGLDGPWSARPSSDLVLQALSGGMAPRGDARRAPLMVGGEPTAWFAGALGAVALLGVLRRISATGTGELIDVSQLESAHLEHSMYPVTYASMAGFPFHQSRGVPVPGIEPTSDGYVGFFVITGQQWLDFCALIEHPEWTEDPTYFIALERRLRAEQLLPAIRDWTTQRTTAEIVEIASLMRIPVAPIGNGRTIPEIDHFVEEQWLLRHPAGFVQPRRPYRFAGEPVPAVADTPAPASTPASGAWTAGRIRRRQGPRRGQVSDLPLAGVRVADFTAFWAGPLAAQILAGLGAEVIHIEGPKRPDGIRMNTLRKLTDDQWWEWSPLFCGANTNKRDMAVDLSTEAGHEIALKLLATCDLMIENFSPRVVEQLGLAPEALLDVNPRLTVVRMPAFGLSGPWRDRVGFAQTIEQASGLAFLTGYEGESPVIPNGMCDPIAGVHAAIAALVALEQQHHTGRGQVVEAAMIGAALNTAAEQIVDYSAYGHLLASAGNSSPLVDQVVARCDGDDEWVAITLPDEEARQSMWAATGTSDLDQLSEWCAAKRASDVEQLGDALGVPVGRVTWAHEITSFPQLIERGFFEHVAHAVTGTHPYVSFPARFSAGPHQWNRHGAPTLGGDNQALLTELGYDSDAIARLREGGVIAEGVVSSQHGW